MDACAFIKVANISTSRGRRKCHGDLSLYLLTIASSCTLHTLGNPTVLQMEISPIGVTRGRGQQLTLTQQEPHRSRRLGC